MTRTEKLAAVLFAAAGVMVAVGAGLVYFPAGMIVGGVLLSLWTWTVLTGVDTQTRPVAVSERTAA